LAASGLSTTDHQAHELTRSIGLPLEPFRSNIRICASYLKSRQWIPRRDTVDADTLIDAFVRKINRFARTPHSEEDIPHRLREGGAEYGLYYDWTIQRLITSIGFQFTGSQPPGSTAAFPITL